MLYPILHRLESKRWIKSYWGVAENGRKTEVLSTTEGGREKTGRATKELGHRERDAGEISGWCVMFQLNEEEEFSKNAAE
jgi:DNA-binding PadR family transcriptional regulator